MPEIGEVVSGKYRILDHLGSGAMGIVFSAVHIETEKQVALKWLNPAISSMPGGAERFRREAKATGRIHHPNVVAVHDCGEHTGQLYIVMEHLKGRTLRAHLNDAPDKRLPLAEALALLIPVMRGISAAHSVGVLHRDMKPENVLLCESPDGLPALPKVLDFGLAKVRSDVGFATKLSMAGALLGTFQYMAPELLHPDHEPDERVDVYALGAMLYELLSGLPPYCAENAVDLVLQIHAGDAPEIASLVHDLPHELSPVLARALARDPEARYRDVASFALDLEPFTAERLRSASSEHAKGAAAPPIQPQLIDEGQPPAARATAVRLAPPSVRSHSRRSWLHVALSLAVLLLEPSPMDARPAARAEDSAASSAPMQWLSTPAVAALGGDESAASQSSHTADDAGVEQEAASDWAAAPSAAAEALVPEPAPRDVAPAPPSAAREPLQRRKVARASRSGVQPDVAQRPVAAESRRSGPVERAPLTREQF